MHPTTQHDHSRHSPSPSSDHSTVTDPITSQLLPGPNIVVESPSSKSPSNQATAHDPLLAPVTVADVKQLLANSRALISDLSILNGEFANTNSERSSILMIKESNYDLYTLSDFESRVLRLLKKVEKHEAVDANVAINGSTSSDADAEDLRAKLASDHEKLEQLYETYAQMRDNIEALRRKLETSHKGQYGVYDYELEIKYEVIGNQILPPYYKKPKPKPKKRAVPLESSLAPSSAPSTPAPVAKKAKVSKATAKGEKVKESKDKDNGEKSVRGELEGELARMKKEKALLAIEVNALKAEKKILQS